MMRIAKITVENYKIFKGEHTFDFHGNLAFLVGENNTGKSTLFEAVNFVKSGLPKEKNLADIKNKFSSESDQVVCTIKFVGQIKDVIKDFSDSKYEPYVFEESGVETLLVQRSSMNRRIQQNGKERELSVKTVTLWNQATKQFENPSGIDTVLGNLFEAQFIWADTDPADVSDFGATKICGRLLGEVVGDFFEGDQWKKFSEVHKETFLGGGDSLSKRAQTIEADIKSILEAQYGKAEVKFNFALPETAAFFKAGDITVDDGVETKLEDKGTGMQRAIALAMIQVYAKKFATHPEDSEKTKPLFFFIDEPEVCLHPKAQFQLLDALTDVAKLRQVFLSSHSPYFLKQFKSKDHDLFIFNKVADNVIVTRADGFGLFSWSPSLGEINHKAYGLYTAEFHNELYGYLQEKEQMFKEVKIEEFFVSKLLTKHKTWVRVNNGTAELGYPVTLMTFIRNTIHHPENRQNADFSEQELKDSIDAMITLAK